MGAMRKTRFAGKPERANLDHHRNGLHYEYPAYDGPGQFLAHNHGHRAQRGAQGKGSDVAHEDLGGVTVEPEKTQSRTPPWRRR